MTTLRKSFISVTAVVLASGGLYEARQAAQLSEKNRTLQQAQTTMSEQNTQLESERDDALNRINGLLAENSRLKSNSNENDLFKLRGEIARLKNDLLKAALLNAAQTSANNSTSPIAPIILAQRAGRIDAYLQKHPEEQIPELQYASMNQWLNAVLKPVESDDDIRNALTLLRNQAQSHFMTQYIKEAASQFQQANNGQFPSDLSELQNYLDPAVENVVSQNYEIAQASVVTDPTAHVTGDWIIKRKTNVNSGWTKWLAISMESNGYLDNVWYDSEAQN